MRTSQPEINGLVLEEPEKIDFGPFVTFFGSFEGNASSSTRATSRERTDDRKFVAEKIDAKLLRSFIRDPDGFSLAKVADATRLSRHADLIRLLGKHLKLVPA